MRITDKLKKQILSLREKGLSYSKISLKLNISEQQVLYHLNSSFKEKMKQRSRKNSKGYFQKNKKRLTEQRKDYNREYNRKRYNNDEEFRKKQIESSTKWRKKNE